MINYRHLLIYQHIGLNLGYRGYPVKKHALYKHRHETPPLFDSILEPPVPVSIYRKEGVPCLDQVTFFGMQQDTCPTVMGGSGSPCKGDKGRVVHLDHVTGCRGFDHELVFTGG